MVAPTIVPDGTTDFSGGQNAGVSAHALAPNQYSIGVNTSIETHSLKPRWAIHQKQLDFTGIPSYRTPTGRNVSFEDIYYAGRLQANIPYGVGVQRYVIHVVAGFIFAIDVNSGVVQLLNQQDPLNYYTERINWSPAGNYVVVYDWPNRPMVLDGLAVRRSREDLDEVPVAVLGAYNQNRLCVANAGIEWTAGDPSGSRFTPNAPVSFLELFLSASPYFGDVYQVPTASKYNESITAMGFLQYVDNSTGIGPLVVSTQSSIYTYRTDLPRAAWQGGASSIVFGSMLLPTTGIAGQRAHTNVNSDLLFLGTDGQVYALSMSRNDQRRWGSAPISQEVENFLPTDRELSYVGVAKYFGNKVFITTQPHRVDCLTADGVPQTDYTNAGVVVLEFNVVSGIVGFSQPVWSGLWTGVMFNDFAEMDGVLYIAGKHAGRNGLFYFDPESSVDIIDGKERDIRSVLVTKEYDHGDTTANKELHSLDIGLRELEEKVTIEVQYKPSTSGVFTPWATREFTAPVLQKGTVEYPNGLARQGLRDYTLGGVDENVCVPGTRDLQHVYKGVQLRVILTGRYWELEYLKLKGRVLPRTDNEEGCSTVGGEPSPRDCFNYFEIPEGC